MSIRTDRDTHAKEIQRRQHGLITRAQAIEVGFSSSAIDRKLARDLWVVLYPGTYCELSAPQSPYRQPLAACLACGPAAVAVKLTAGLVWELDVPTPSQPQILVPRHCRAEPDGIAVTRTLHLPRLDATVHNGVPVTSPMPTLVYLAPEVDAVTLEIAFDTLWRRGSIHPDRLAQYLDQPRHRRRPGTGTLREIIENRARKPSDSGLESWYFSILRHFRVPRPDRKVWVRTPDGPFELDYAYAAKRVAVELDGFDDHGTNRRRFTGDRTRQMLIERYDWRFLRFTRDHLSEQPLWVAMMTADAIGLVPARWRKV